MGDITDMILEGLLCELCGQYIESEPQGYPRLCGDCN